MIKIPDYLEIGGVTYKVTFSEDLPAGRVAQIHFTDGEIQIDSTMCSEVVFLSFMHEVVHGCMQSQNHFPNDMIYNDEDFTERTAQLITSVFKQIFEFNIHYEEYFAPQTEELEAAKTSKLGMNAPQEEKDVLDIKVELEE